MHARISAKPGLHPGQARVVPVGKQRSYQTHQPLVQVVIIKKGPVVLLYKQNILLHLWATKANAFPFRLIQLRYLIVKVYL